MKFLISYCGGMAGDMLAAIISPQPVKLWGSKINPSEGRIAAMNIPDNSVSGVVEDFRHNNEHCLTIHTHDHVIPYLNDIFEVLFIVSDDYELTHIASIRKFNLLPDSRATPDLMTLDDNTINNVRKCQRMIETANQYQNIKLINFRDILNGNVINVLEGMGYNTHNHNLYKDWLVRNKFYSDMLP